MERHNYEVGRIYGIKKLLGIEKDEKGHSVAVVKCIKCGKETRVKPSQIFQKKHQSCRCQTTLHNLSNSRIYGIYHNMKDRCYNPKCCNYKNYGLKGIGISEEWKNSFIAFYQWSINNGYNDNLTIDRIDSNKNYSPENCRWVSLSENTRFANISHKYDDIPKRKTNNGTYYGISPEGERYEFNNASKFAFEHNLNANMVRKTANKRSVYKKWFFGFVNDLNNRSQSTIETVDTFVE